MSHKKSVCVVVGADGDLPIMQGAIDKLKYFGVPFSVRVVSAHRTPYQAEELAKTAREKGVGVIIAAAGKAAHLAGVLAAYTTLPVIAVPLKASTLDGLDALLSMVQMPTGVPVATVAIDGAANAGILAAQILSVEDPELTDKLAAFKDEMTAEYMRKDAEAVNRNW